MTATTVRETIWIRQSLWPADVGANFFAAGQSTRPIGRRCLGDPAPLPSMFEPNGATVVSIDGPRIAGLAQFLL